MKETPKKIAVIGLGNFGKSLVEELIKQNSEVIAIDIKQELVNNVSSIVNNAICFDCTNEKLVRGYGIGTMDLAIVAIGENFGSTVIITKILKDLELKVYSRASSDREEEILKAVGADKIYRPEHEQGVEKAQEITYSRVKDFVALRGNMDLIVTEPDKLMLGKRVNELDIRRVYEINIAMLGKKQSDNEHEYRIPGPDDLLEKGDLLWLIGSREHIHKFLER